MTVAESIPASGASRDSEDTDELFGQRPSSLGQSDDQAWTVGNPRRTLGLMRQQVLGCWRKGK
jgi:hypothetical protein